MSAEIVEESLTPLFELYLSGRDLKNMDFFSKSDCFAVLYSVSAEGSMLELGRTEVIRDDLNPQWTKQFVVDYYFEEVQKFCVRVYDDDKEGESDLSAHDYIGETYFQLSQIAKAAINGISFPLSRGSSERGTLFVHGEEMDQAKEFLRLCISCQNLENKDGFFDKSDPYITAHRCKEDNSWSRVWKSITIDNDLNPEFPEVVLSVQKLANGDRDRPIKFEVYDEDRMNDDDYMGEFTATVNQLLEWSGLDSQVSLTDTTKSNKKVGKVTIGFAEIIRIPTMLDYIAGGCEIKLMVGVDYTGSNGEPSNPNSLHYIDPSGDGINEYEAGIDRVGRVLEQYDTDKKYPAFGFGGKFEGKVSHCYPLQNLVANEELGDECKGTEELLEIYRNTMSMVDLAGPTLLCPLLTEAMDRARESKEEYAQAMRSGDTSGVTLSYHVLLVLCDGQFQDIAQAVNMLVDASSLPLSVVIVGIGSDDFSDMIRLDGDYTTSTGEQREKRLQHSNGTFASRDIVQFVAMRSYGLVQSSRLARDVLKEIPKQCTDYFAAENIPPGTPSDEESKN